MKYFKTGLTGRFNLFIPLFLFIISVFSVYGEIGDSEKILIIYPFSEIGEWGLKFNDGFYSRLTLDTSIKPSIYFHFLNTDLAVNEGNRINIEELENLVSTYKFDIVVGLLPPVHNFLIEKGELLFPGTPVLLVAAGDEQIRRIRDKENYSYIESSSFSAITSTLADIKHMFPDLKHLYVHSGRGASDLPYLEIFQKEVPEYFDTSILEYWVGLPFAEVFTLLPDIPDNSVIMLLTVNTDDEGKPYTVSDYFPEYSDAANAPVFSFYDNQFGKGLLGGTMTSAESYGRHAAEAVESIVSGRKYSVAETVDASVKMYDWRQLKRWGVDMARVPGDAAIMFAEDTFLNKYKEIVIITFLIILFQTTTIIVLVNQVKRRRKLHHELENKHIQISESLKAKEILLKEVHHRVKNNLMLVISFLSLQADYITDKKMREILIKLQNRVFAMSLVHEQLYRDDRIEQIDIAGYLKELCESVIYSYEDKNLNIVTYDIDIESNYLSLDLMIPIGLIFNELITNSIKYAFKGIPEPKVIMKGKREADLYLFEYSDNGTGLPENFKLGNDDTLGLLIVKTLISQIKGELKIDQSAGADRFIFSCPVTV